MTPKPTRFLTNMTVDDSRCYCALPKFDKFGFYKGPLPRQCGHEHSHKLIGKTDSQWNTAPSASYPPLLCEFLAGLILHAKASFGRGLVDESVQAPGKRRRLQSGHTEPSTGLALQSSSVAKHSMVSGERGCKQVEDSGKEMGESPARQSNMDAGSQSIDDEQKWPDNGSDEFDLAACCNSGTPIGVEWDTVRRGFIDGFGLCSPCRWKPSRRGDGRTSDMVKLADDTYKILADAVTAEIKDVRREAFKLVTGKLLESPFSESCLERVRSKWFALLDDPQSAAVVDDGQPFYLRALSQWLKRFNDPDVHWLTDVEDSFASGVFVGVDKQLPRSPQVFPPKLKHRKLDETEFVPIAENYASAQVSAKELEDKFREEESLGRMHPSKLGVLKQEFGDSLRVASMAAIMKPDGTVRPLHDATHSVMVNHSIVYRDKIDCPGPAEIASIVREATSTGEAPFCVSADIKAAHRLVKIRRRDWGYLCCRADSGSSTVWVNHTGTFGVASAPYWWAKLAGLIGRFVGHMFHKRWLMHMIYVDDLHGAFVGCEKFLHLWVWVLAFEMVGTPFGYHKFKGGFASEFVGYHIRYDLSQVGITVKRGDWLVQWILKVRSNGYVVPAREFAEFLGRLGFISQLITWLKPHLAPLYAWSAVTARGTVGRLPETIILTLRYIEVQLTTGSYMVSTRWPQMITGERFRTDAKCADGYIVLGGWELESKRWFSLRIGPAEAPFLFKPDGASQWASTAAELLATLAALHAFGWLEETMERKTLEVHLVAGADNLANQASSTKRSTTKWPLMAVNTQLSAALTRARLSLGLQWRPREENTEADQLTNEEFSGFREDQRVVLTWSSLELSVLMELVRTRTEFDLARDAAREAAKVAPKLRKGNVDKSPW